MLIASTPTTDPVSYLAENGAVIFTRDQLPLSKVEWDELLRLTEAVPYKHCTVGDLGEPHDVHLGKFVSDLEAPKQLHPSAGDVLRPLQSQAMKEMYAPFAGRSALCIRRCQCHVLRENGFIGRHTDQDTNLDYAVAMVLHFASPYEGGTYLVQHPTAGERHFKPEPYSLLVGRTDVPHEVTRVTRGERRTLSYFLSTSFGLTRKPDPQSA